jgi:uncharacterized protein YwgA
MPSKGATVNAARRELALVLNDLGVPFDLGTFSQRFNIQKKIYLAQIAGVDLGYRFSWYLRGPYSTGLTEDAFALKDEIAEGVADHEDYELLEDVSHALDKAEELWARPTDVKVSDDDWLELLASLHYLRHIAYRPPGASRDFDEAFTLLVRSKPLFRNKKEPARRAWKRLDEFGLVQAKTLN